MPTSDPQTADCIFCAIVGGDAPASFLYQDDIVVAFMDIRPVQPGHLLVVPRMHAELIPDLDDAVLAAMWSVATRLNRALRAGAPSAEAVSVYVADGEAAGQEIPHVHIHLIPRHADDGFGFRFPPGYGAQPTRAELEAIADRIRRSAIRLTDAPGLRGN
jgi:histidine triad (HIT) family protein